MRARPEVLAYLLLGLVLVMSTTVVDWGVFTPDTKPELYLAPWRTLSASFSTWLGSPYLGSPSFNAGIAPVAAVIGLLHSLAVPVWMTVRIWRLALLGIAAYGAVRCARELCGAGARGRVVAAWLYVLSPYAVVSGATTPILLPHAAFPWLAVFLLRAARSPRGWRWPAAAGLVFAVTAGINAGSTSFLLLLVLLPAVLLHARRVLGVSRGDLAVLMSRIAVLFVLVSLYWLVPAATAAASGSTIVNNTESLSAISASSSYGEVVRGLGFWPMYGSDGSGPWQPGFAMFLREPLVLVLSFTLPILALVGVRRASWRVRPFALGMFVLAAVVMVGLHAVGGATPAGRGWQAILDNLPGAGALRTTNKAGSALVLGQVLLAVCAVEASAESGLRRLGPPLSFGGFVTYRRLSMGAAVVVVVTALIPALAGDPNPVRMPIPSYWKDAGGTLSHGSGRLLLLPGTDQTQYRWGYHGADDLALGLFDRPSVRRTTVQNSSAAATNLLAALDADLQDGSLAPGELSTVARYLGVTQVLLRNDLEWERIGGVRPSVLHERVSGDPGLRAGVSFGRVGGAETTSSADRTLAAFADAALPPLLSYDVQAPVTAARAAAAKGPTVVSGDASALAPLLTAGLLPDRAPLLLAPDLTAGALAAALQDGARLELTDTNRRRETNLHRLTDAHGPLLSAAVTPAVTRSLGTQRDQTVEVLEGATSITATSSGSVFGPVPQGRAELAFDGDPTTSWLGGDFGAGVGQQLRVRFGQREMGDVTIQLAPTGPVTIGRLRVTAGSTSRDVSVPPGSREVHVSLAGVRASDLTVRITATRGKGINAIGLSEVRVPGLRVRTLARLPTELVAQLVGMANTDRLLVASTPMDVLLNRAQGDPSTAVDDEEAGLDRTFDLPDSRSFYLTGQVRPEASLTARQADDIAGTRGAVQVTASSQGSLASRGSLAFDGSPYTAWAPSGGETGAWVEAAFPRRRVDHVVIDQGPDAARITGVRLEFDSGSAVIAQLAPGRTRIPVPPRSATRLRVVVTGTVSGAGTPRLEEVDVAGARVPTQRHAHPCLSAGTLDGSPLALELQGSVESFLGGSPTSVTRCGRARPLDLAAGTHRLMTSGGAVQVDKLTMYDARSGALTAPTPAAAPRLEVTASSDTRTVANVAAASSAYWVTNGQSWDDRWQASVDGRSLGPPQVFDGYAAGWRVTDLRAHRLVIAYRPQRAVLPTVLISALVMLCCLGLLAAGSRAGRDPVVVATAPPPPLNPAWAALLLLGGAVLVGNWWLGLAALGIVLLHRLRPSSSSTFAAAAPWACATVPLAWLLANGLSPRLVTPALVYGAPAAHVLAALALLLAVAGVVLTDTPEISRRRRAGVGSVRAWLSVRRPAPSSF